MNYRRNFKLATAACISFLILVASQQTQAQRSWLDRPLRNWNEDSGNVRNRVPQSAATGDSSDSRRCRSEVRQPASAAERSLKRRGWMMYGPVYSYGVTRVVTALSGFDGMCRPLGFQAFVYSEGVYAGTLSPVPMDSRSDGSLSDVHLNSGRNVSADFVRYKDSDPLCCPSRISSVNYSLRGGDTPTITPRSVAHRAIAETIESIPPDSNNQASLFGKRWTLTQIEDRRLSAGRPYIQFSGDQGRVSGSGGCNSLAGTFQIDGPMLKLSRITSTRRACVDTELQRIETEFLRLLETTTRFEVHRNTLRLYADDRLILAFANK